ncbi:HIT family protein [Streptomyces microflavus]|uniref:HIT family protein n=1 Tax=Streptomyces microflavus TaxID=1919 RepID=UPI0037D7B0B7
MAFLHRWPTLPGKVLVAPREHVEDVVSGFSDDGYMRMMQAVRRVALAVEAVLAPERVSAVLGVPAGKSACALARRCPAAWDREPSYEPAAFATPAPTSSDTGSQGAQ